MERSELLEQMSQQGLGRLADSLIQQARPSIRILTEPGEDAEIPVGASKFGGDPDLPEGFEWPEWNGEPLAFLAQISLADLLEFPEHELLPPNGLLSFFYDREQSTWGFDPEHRGSWRVVYHATEMLRRTSPPTPVPDEAMFDTCGISFEGGLAIPGWELLDHERLQFTDEEQSAFFEVMQGTEGMEHHLFGYAHEIQGEMSTECQLVSNGVYCGSGDPLSTPEGKRLAPGAKDWRLLLQLDSDDSVGWMWGDCGRLYFWIREEDLKARRFENCWMILQCA
ncbi:MAG: DUF1963 domain-containing protein [Planctomycetaceae bacterium]|nr:DUF1963 domain-containing protein [Planctomycetaceae bacterium]